MAHHGQELRFVGAPYAWIATRLEPPTAKAEVDVNNDDGRKKVHSAFVPRGSPAAVSALDAWASTMPDP